MKQALHASCIDMLHIKRALTEHLPIWILGYGITTKPLVSLLNERGIACVIYDDAFHSKHTEGNNICLPSSSIPLESTSANKRAHTNTNAHEYPPLVILSPGIPPNHAYFSHIKNAISEYDFFFFLMHVESTLDASTAYTHDFLPMHIWISGTNGKTTTTEMIAHILKPYGALAGGNIGTPLATLYRAKAPIFVLETSSFTLHYTHVASPHIYALLPLSPDHISWHGNFEAYIEAKLSPLKRMDTHSIAIIPRTLKAHALCKSYKGKAIFYADSNELVTHIKALYDALNNSQNESPSHTKCTQKALKSTSHSTQTFIIKQALRELPFFEPFFLDAMLAILSVASLLHITSHQARQFAQSRTIPFKHANKQASSPMPFLSLTDSNSFWQDALMKLAQFHIGAHRIEEFFISSHGYKWLFVDDSKGTNVDATIHAITRYKHRALFLILGGDDKGADALALFTLLNKLARVEVFTIGSNESTLLKLADNRISIHPCGTLENAMQSIYHMKNSIIQALSQQSSTPYTSLQQFAQDFVCLLSPAAASLDQFSSYKERGDRFKSLAHSLNNNTSL